MKGNDKVSKETATKPNVGAGRRKKRRGPIVIVLVLGVSFLLLVIIPLLSLRNQPTEIGLEHERYFVLHAWQLYRLRLPPWFLLPPIGGPRQPAPEVHQLFQDSPAEDQTKRTAAAFLDACEKGDYKAAAQKYLPPEDVPQPNKTVSFQSTFSDVSAYAIDAWGTVHGGKDNGPFAEVYIQSKSGVLTAFHFLGNEDGSHIRAIYEVPPPTEKVWHDTPKVTN